MPLTDSPSTTTASSSTPPPLFSPASISSAFAHSPSPSPSPSLGQDTPGGLGDLQAVLSALQELHPGAARARGDGAATADVSASVTPRMLSPRPSRTNMRFRASNISDSPPSTPSSSSSSAADNDSAAELSTVWSGPMAAYLSPSGPSSPEHSSSPSSFSPSPTHPVMSPVPLSLDDKLEPEGMPPEAEGLGDFSGVLAYLHSQTTRLKDLVDLTPAVSRRRRHDVAVGPTVSRLRSEADAKAEAKRRALLDSLVRSVADVAGARSILDEDEEVDMEISDGDQPVLIPSLASQASQRPTTRAPLKIVLPTQQARLSSRKRPPLASIPNPLLAVPSLAPPARLMELANKLMKHFPEDRAMLEGLQRETGSFKRAWGAQRGDETREGEVHVFIDHSNILVGYLDWLKQHPHPSRKKEQSSRPTLSYPALALLLERGRRVASRVLVASSPLYSSLEPMEALGYAVSVLQRVPQRPKAKPGSKGSGSGSGRATKPAKPAKKVGNESSTDTDTANNSRPPLRSRPPRFKEQAVDELLQLHIYKSLLSVTNPPPPGSTIVLATGDAASSEFNTDGFVGCARSAVRMGWRVEVVGWQSGLGKGWLDLGQNYNAETGEGVRVEGLEQYGWDLFE